MNNENKVSGEKSAAYGRTLSRRCPMKRRSGRTFRYVLWAVIDASLGRRVVYVGSTVAATDVALNYALIASKAISPNAISRKVRSRIEFTDSGGSIDFVSIKTTLDRHHKYDATIKDLG